MKSRCVRYLSILVAMLFLASACAQQPPSSNSPLVRGPESSEVPSPEATPKLMISIVYDNNGYDELLEARWGFSCLIEGLEKTVLFDTGGDSVTLLGNMRKLKIDLAEIDVVILSHIHGDHVGGLSGFLEENSSVVVCLPDSFPQDLKDSARSLGVEIDEVSEAKELFTGAYTTGELGDGIKEQSLILKTSKGLVIITGCAHPGVVNIIHKARDVVPEDTVYLVMGGFHLTGAATSHIESVVTEFRQLCITKVAPCHCSGDETRRLFQERYGEDYIDSGVGRRITIP